LISAQRFHPRVEQNSKDRFGWHKGDTLMLRVMAVFGGLDALTRKLLTVSKSTIDARHAEHKARVADNPKKRGPKPKA
jgi:hypothetical protein